MDKKEYDDVIMLLLLWRWKRKSTFCLCLVFLYNKLTRNVNVLCMSSCGRYSALG